MPMTASVMISGAKVLAASGNNCRQYRSMPNVPTLSTTAIINTAVAGVACTAASGSQAWNGHSGALIANANMKPKNRPQRGGTPPLALATVVPRGHKEQRPQVWVERSQTQRDPAHAEPL